MEEFIKYLQDTRLEGLKGMKIEGEIPLSEEQLNVLLDQFVRPQLEPKKGAPTPAPAPNPMAELLPLLKFPVLKAEIKDKKLVLKVKVEA